MQRDVMVISLAVLGGYGTLRRVRVSLPLVPALLDDRPDKYALPENLPPPNKVDSQPIGRRRLYGPNHFYRQRGGLNAER
jgi:hypothetical protein